MTTANTAALYVALELGCDKWVLASATQAAEKPRFRTVPARNNGMDSGDGAVLLACDQERQGAGFEGKGSWRPWRASHG